MLSHKMGRGSGGEGRRVSFSKVAIAKILAGHQPAGGDCPCTGCGEVFVVVSSPSLKPSLS